MLSLFLVLYPGSLLVVLRGARHEPGVLGRWGQYLAPVLPLQFLPRSQCLCSLALLQAVPSFTCWFLKKREGNWRERAEGDLDSSSQCFSLELKVPRELPGSPKYYRCALPTRNKSEKLWQHFKTRFLPRNCKPLAHRGLQICSGFFVFWKQPEWKAMNSTCPFGQKSSSGCATLHSSCFVRSCYR